MGICVEVEELLMGGGLACVSLELMVLFLELMVLVGGSIQIRGIGAVELMRPHCLFRPQKLTITVDVSHWRHVGLKVLQLVDFLVELLEPLVHVLAVQPTLNIAVAEGGDRYLELGGVFLDSDFVGLIIDALDGHLPPFLQLVVQKRLVEALGCGIEGPKVLQVGSLQDCDSDAECLCLEFVDEGVLLPLLDGGDLLRGQVGPFVFIEGLDVVGGLRGEGKQIGCLDLALFIDEDVLGANVAHFAAQLLEVMGGRNEGVEQVPDFGFIEVAVNLPPVLELVGQHVRVVIEVDLYYGGSTFMVPDEPQIALRE